MKKLIWRIRFTLYGYKKTTQHLCCGIYVAHVPLRIWWEWSESSADLFGIATHPHGAADEEIWALTT